MIVESPLNEHVEGMRIMAKMLIPHTFPKVSFKEELDILILKQRTFNVDGYDVLVCLSEADYGKYIRETIQLQATFAPFLPFTVVCKIGRAFLGEKNLSFIDFFKNNRKVYCWTKMLRDGRSLPPDKKSKPGSYEGFEYCILRPGSVDLY